MQRNQGFSQWWFIFLEIFNDKFHGSNLGLRVARDLFYIYILKSDNMSKKKIIKLFVLTIIYNTMKIIKILKTYT